MVHELDSWSLQKQFLGFHYDWGILNLHHLALGQLLLVADLQ